MKFNEMTFTRPDIDALLAECKQLAAKAAAADSDEAIVETYYEPSHTVMVLRFLYGKSDWASILKKDLPRS